MFGLWNKSKKLIVSAPVSGKCLDVSECKDPTFSKKILGDGFVIEPIENTICSPCDGVLTMVFPTKHAFGIKTKDGKDILVHIGIDTVNLHGEGFKQLVSVNKKVSKGTAIIDCDIDKVKANGLDSSVIVVLTGGKELQKQHIDEEVKVGDAIIEEEIL